MHESSRDLGPSDIWVLTRIIYGAQLTWPINSFEPPRSDVDLSDADVQGLASTQVPQARVVTCFSEEAK